MRKVLYTKYSRTRNLKFQMATKIVEDGEKKFVEKTPLTKEALNNIQEYKNKYNINYNIYKNILPLKGEWEKDKIVFPFLSGNSMKSIINSKKFDMDLLLKDIDTYLDIILDYKDSCICDFILTDEFYNVFGVNIEFPCKAVQYGDIDAIFDNIIYYDNEWYSIDYEWTFNFPIPIDFIKYRILCRYYYNERGYFENKISEKDFLIHFGLKDYEIKKFKQCELGFQYYVYGKNCKYVYTERYKKESVDFLNLVNKYGNIEAEFNKKENDIRKLQYESKKYKDNYNRVINSLTWKFTLPIRKVMNIPLCIKEHGLKYTVHYILTGKGLENKEYSKKMPSFKYNLEEIKKQSNTKFNKKIKFSILVPLFNTPEQFLREMIDSVLMQTYSNWELCLADGSDDKHSFVQKICLEYKEKDLRIKYRKLDNNGGISENTNVCIDMAEGDYVVLFDHDDILHLSALYECMKVIEKESVDYIYTDEATFIGNIDNVINVNYKPDYSPDTLRSYNYICHLSVFKKELLDKVGKFNKKYEGSQDYDMILRLTELANKIVHIPNVLYFWRAHKKSVAQDISAKPYTLVAAKQAITEHLHRVGLEGEVLDGRVPSVYRIKYKIIGCPKVSILIPNKDHISELNTCIKSVCEKSSYKNFEIIIIENNSEDNETFKYYNEIQNQYDNIKVIYWKKEFNYSAINNFGFENSSGEYVLLLNNDVEIISNDWIEEMLMFAQRNDVGAVGAMLYYPDDTIQHAGVILGIGGVAGHSHKHFDREDFGYASRLTLVQNLSAITAACMLMKREVFEEVGGLDESFKVAFNDIDLCMKLREKGYLNVFTPFAELYHYESKSRGLEDTEEKQLRFKGEIELFMSKWGQELEKGDPYYNPNLSLIHEDFSFK